MNFHRKPITYVSQVKLKVQNLERSLAFYQKVIGFKFLEQSDNHASFTVDGKTALLSIERPNHVIPKQVNTTGLYHYALLLLKRSDLAHIVQHFLEVGLQFASSDHRVSEALYLSDPDGNGIEIYVDRNPSEWKWNHGEVEMTVDPLNFSDLLSCKEKQPWKGLPAETVMGHIHLHVSDLKTAEEFYSTGLGFEVVNRYGKQAIFLSDGKYHHHIGLNTWNGVGAPSPAPHSVGLQSFTLMLPNEQKRDQIRAQLKGIGASMDEQDSSLVTSDPSGNLIFLRV